MMNPGQQVSSHASDAALPAHFGSSAAMFHTSLSENFVNYADKLKLLMHYISSQGKSSLAVNEH